VRLKGKRAGLPMILRTGHRGKRPNTQDLGDRIPIALPVQQQGSWKATVMQTGYVYVPVSYSAIAVESDVASGSKHS
jgi:hypothetical protein